MHSKRFARFLLRYLLDPADVHAPDFPGETFHLLKEKDQAKFCEWRTSDAQRVSATTWQPRGGCSQGKRSGPDKQCRLLIGMQRLPHDELRQCLSLVHKDEPIDNPTAIRLKRKLAEEFRNQLAMGAPTDADEAGLRRLAPQVKAGSLAVKPNKRVIDHLDRLLARHYALEDEELDFIPNYDIKYRLAQGTEAEEEA